MSPLVARTGSLKTGSAQGVPVHENNRITPQNKYAANSGDVDRLNYIKDTYTTQSAQNPNRYPEEYRALLAYPEGYAMQVTYFHRNHPNIDTRSMASELIDKEDAVHTDLTRILNLEMKLTDQLQFDIRDEDNTFLISGQAVMYPGLEPYIGDLFYLEIDNNNIYLFRINDIRPTTYRQERYYAIQFSTYTKVTEEVYAKLNNKSINTMVFDKRAYFGSSEYSLLTYNSYFVLKKLRKLRKSIAQDLVNFFYDSSVQTFLRPDKIYDPYVVEYLKRKINVSEDGVRPIQLYPRLDNYYRSIWHKIVDSEHSVDFSYLYSHYVIRDKIVDMFDSDINGLMGKQFLILTDKSGKVKQDTENTYFKSPVDLKTPYFLHHCNVPESKEVTYEETSYILSQSFYSGQKNSTVTLEKYLYEWLVEDKINPKEIFSLTEKYRKFGFDTNDAFYTFCIYLALIDASTIRLTE